jgi:hypothetical protein
MGFAAAMASVANPAAHPCREQNRHGGALVRANPDDGYAKLSLK